MNDQSTRVLLPLADSLRWLFLDGEWSGELKPAAYGHFMQSVGRLPYILPKSSFPPIRGAAAGTWTFTNNTRTYILDGTFDWNSDSFKMALFLSTSDIGAASTTFAGVSNQHAGNNGYTAGGIAITISLSGTTTVTVDSTDPVWTASGGPITARFAVIYEVSGNVACYALLDSAPADVTATDGNTLTVQINASGVFTLA